MKEQREKELLKAEMDHNYKNFKKSEKAAEKQIGDLKSQLEIYKVQLKEKEQLYRISTYKLNELKRSVKHKQLKPLGGGSGSNKDAQSTSTANKQ